MSGRGWIVLVSYPYEGLDAMGYGEEDNPLPIFDTRDEAEAWAKEQGLISPKGRRNDAEILAVTQRQKDKT